MYFLEKVPQALLSNVPKFDIPECSYTLNFSWKWNIFFSVFVLLLASNGTLLRLLCSPCSVSAADVWQHFDLKQPQAKLRLKMQQLTICSPHSCRYCVHSPHLERWEWQRIVSTDRTLKCVFIGFPLKDGGVQQWICFLWQVFPPNICKVAWL